MDNVLPARVLKEREKKRKKSKKPKAKDEGEPDNKENLDDDRRGSIVELEQEGGDIVVEDSSEETERERTPTTLEKIEEILNPTFKFPETKGLYVVPDAVLAGDINALRDIDENKIIELKEVFTLFDTDADGFISADDLNATFIALSKEACPETIQQMLTEAMSPLDFDAFVALMGCKMIELDPEDVLLEAWSKWDREGTGFICEESMFHDLVTYGDRFTEKEARRALEEAPIVKPKTLDEPPMIDYQAFCRTLGGLRKRKQNEE